jgi:hypothetical protein
VKVSDEVSFLLQSHSFFSGELSDQIEFATIAQILCYDVSGEISGETGLFVIELLFAAII